MTNYKKEHGVNARLEKYINEQKEKGRSFDRLNIFTKIIVKTFGKEFYGFGSLPIQVRFLNKTYYY